MSAADWILRPLALPYELIVRLHARAYSAGIFAPRRIDHAIVISVGNLTVGGTGKTPLVLWIAARLLQQGESVAILTRGYRGKSDPVHTTAGQTAGSHPNSTSDEVQLLQDRLGPQVAFGVGADRVASGRDLARRGVKWFILDDGFQHRRLARDVDIVLIDATNPFGGGHLLPAGRLREPRSALARADLIVITRSEYAPAIEAAVRHDSSAPVFYATPELESILSLGEPPSQSLSQPLAEIPLGEARERKLFAFCGIGNPPAFLANLRDWGLQIVGHRFFRDHNRYTPQQAMEIESEARSLGADALVCTEKDRFNLQDVRWAALPVLCCRISLRVVCAEEFWQAILAKAHSRRRA